MIEFQEKQDVRLWLLFGTLKPAINHKIKITQIAFAFPEKPQLMFFCGEKNPNNTLPLAHGRSKPPSIGAEKILLKLTQNSCEFVDPVYIMEVNFTQLMKRSRLPTSVRTVKCGFYSCGVAQSCGISSTWI